MSSLKCIQIKNGRVHVTPFYKMEKYCSQKLIKVQRMNLKSGDLIYCVIVYEHDVKYEDFYYLCSENGYILAVQHYFMCSNFKNQVEQMYSECEKCETADLYVFKKDMVFYNEKNAELKCREIEKGL